MGGWAGAERHKGMSGLPSAPLRRVASSWAGGAHSLGSRVQRPSSAAVRRTLPPAPRLPGLKEGGGLARRRLHGTRHTCVAKRERPVHLPRELSPGPAPSKVRAVPAAALVDTHKPSVPTLYVARAQTGLHSPTRMSRTLPLLKMLRGRCHYR